MKQVTIRVPATTANLGPGFDAFGCALSLYTDVTFEETEEGLEITGCDEAYTGPDNLAYTAWAGCSDICKYSPYRLLASRRRAWARMESPSSGSGTASTVPAR